MAVMWTSSVPVEPERAAAAVAPLFAVADPSEEVRSQADAIELDNAPAVRSLA